MTVDIKDDEGVRVDDPDVYHRNYSGVHYEFVKSAIPSGLINTSDTMREVLRRDLLLSHSAQQKYKQATAAVQDINAFCRPLLNRLVAENLGRHVDVDACRIAVVWSSYIETFPVVVGIETLSVDWTLYQAALQNFGAQEARLDPYFATSKIYDTRKKGNSTLSGSPSAYAQSCRALDLGGRYQGHLDRVLNAPANVSLGRPAVAALFAENERCLMRVQAHVSYMNQDIPETAYRRLMALCSGDSNVEKSWLTLGGVELTGVLVIGPREIGVTAQRCIFYIPGDPLEPLKEFGSFSEGIAHLVGRLVKNEYGSFFHRFVPEGQWQTVSVALISYLKSSNRYINVGELVGAAISLADRTYISGELFQTLHTQHLQRVKTDAQRVAVPTTQADSAEVTKRKMAVASKLINLATLALSFVPVLRVGMLAVAGYQIISDVYHGFNALKKGEKDQAVEYLLDVANSIVSAAAFHRVGVATQLIRKVSVPEVLHSMMPVMLNNNTRGLWKPDMAPYHRNIEIPEGLKPDVRGVYVVADELYLPYQGNLLAVEHNRYAGRWEVKPTEVSANYSPVLRENGTGAWMHEAENPHEWSPQQLLSRLGDEAKDAPPIVLDIVGVDPLELLRGYSDHPQLPTSALLRDTLKRFRLDREINEAITALPSPRASSPDSIDLQFQLISRMPGFSKLKRRIRLVDVRGNLVKEYGDVSDPAFLIRQRELKEHSVLGVTLQKMNVTWEQLIGPDVDPVSDGLRQRFFEARYKASELAEDLVAKLIQSSVPDVPKAMAEELALHSTETARLTMIRNNSLSATVREELKWYQKDKALNRVLESWYLDSVAEHEHSDRLAMRTLDRLAGWADANLRVDLRQGLLASATVETAGAHDASLIRVIVKSAEGYKLYDVEGEELSGGFSPDIFDALARAIPKPQLFLMKISEGAAGFRDALVAHIAAHRRAAKWVLQLAPFGHNVKSPMKLASGRANDPAVVPEPISGTPTQWITTVSEPLPERRVQHERLVAHLPAGSLSSRVRSKLNQLYPGIVKEAEVAQLLRELGDTDSVRLIALEARRLEFEELTRSLDSWVYDRSSVERRGTFTDRRLVASTIVRCWQRRSARAHTAFGTTGYELELPSRPVGQLPILTGANFNHVITLWANDMALVDGVSGFLDQFPRLRWLSLGSNRLQVLPAAIAAMPNLERLHLQNNRIALTPSSVALLAERSRLTTINLSGNPLGRVPNVVRMTNLRELNLRYTDIDRWPEGLLSLQHLNVVSLADNRIANIPTAVYGAPARLNRVTYLTGNPLTEESLAALSAYERDTHINFGVENRSSRALGARPPMARVRARPESSKGIAHWLEAVVDEQERTLKTDQWQELSGQAGSADFFAILNELSVTHEYRYARADLTRRVWSVLNTAYQSEEHAKALFAVADERRAICDDGIELGFSELEIKALACDAQVSAEGDGSEKSLLRLARGLVRLHWVEESARTEMKMRLLSKRIVQIRDNARTNAVGLEGEALLAAQRLGQDAETLMRNEARDETDAAGKSVGITVTEADISSSAHSQGIDEVEVRLFYRVALAHSLDLPGQPRYMHYEEAAGVTANMLERTRQKVEAQDRSQETLELICQQDFWRKYLKAHYPERFNGVNKPFYRTQSELEVKTGSPSLERKIAMGENFSAQQAAEEELIRALTLEAIDRYPLPEVKSPITEAAAPDASGAASTT